MHALWFRHLAAVLWVALPAFAPASARAATAVTSGPWSSPATWGGALPSPEEDVLIPSGTTVSLDVSTECGAITVEGRLQDAPADVELVCDSLFVQGSAAIFEAGTATSRHTRQLTLTLKGDPSETVMSMGARLIGAHNGGTLSLHGEDRVSWTRAAAPVAAASSSLTLADPVNWRPGDRIVISSSRLDWNEAETRTIASVAPDGLSLTVTQPFSFPHSATVLSRTRHSDGKTWTTPLGAEVGLLTRNLRIRGAADSETTGFGGHLMIMNGGSTCCLTSGRAFIAGVEFHLMGQKSLLGRYPMHWHMVAQDGAGQYLKDSSIHQSFNRAVVIHGTESVLVENNFCHDHIGHGIFLEDGSERFNTIRRNVVLLTKRPAAGEEITPSDNSDNEVQNRTPSSFWITNPNNHFTDNVAAGTQGTGFWFAMPKKPMGLSATHPRFSALEPHKQPLGSFDRNMAHSCMNGFDVNDQLNPDHSIVKNGEWANNGPFYLNDCVWHTNNVGIYAGIGGRRSNVIYQNNILADNETHLFLATYQLVDESLIVADSGSGMVPSSRTRTLYAIYDGAGRLKNCHVTGFNASNTRFLQNIGAATKHPNHRFEGLTFDPPVTPRSSLTDYRIVPPADIGANDPGHPRIWAGVIHDVDGSVAGLPGAAIVSNHRFLLTGGEWRPLQWSHTWRSPRRFAQWRMSYSLASDQNPNVSVIRTKPGTPDAGVYYINGYKEHHQLPFIVNDDFVYTCFYESLPSSKRINLTLDDASAGDAVLIRMKHLGALSGLAISGMTARSSLASVLGSSTSSFHVSPDGDLYLRPVATSLTQSYTVTWSTSVTLPPVDSDADGTTDGDEAAAGTDPFRAPGGTDPFESSEFNLDGGYGEWISFSNISPTSVANGALNGTVTGTSDAQMTRSRLLLAGNNAPFLLVRARASSNTSSQIYWGRSGASGFSGSRVRSLSLQGGNVWRVLQFPMNTHPDWSGQTITDFRLDPASNLGVSFSIDWIRASDGDFDDDGITDSIEGGLDLDNDGLVNLEDLDSDGDTLSDAVETALGLSAISPINPSLDSDGDGQSDLLEVHAGMDRASASDRFVWNLTTISNALRIELSVKPGRTYQIWSATDLHSAWTPVQSIKPNEPGTHITNLPIQQTRGFYRVSIRMD